MSDQSQPNEVIKQIKSELDIAVKLAVSGASLTTFAIGGPFRFFVELQDVLQLQRLVKILSSNNQFYKIIGAGSNLLVSDVGVADWVVKLGRGFRYFEKITSNQFKIGAAYSLMSLSRELSQAGMSGLEFAGGIPASIGGAVYMNSGAHNSEMSSIITAVNLVTSDGELVELSGNNMQWDYRRSHLPQNSLVYAANIKLTESDSEATAKRRSECLDYRKKTQPLAMPSAGSVFKNPSTEISAGYLIEQVGLKGEVRGQAQVSELHGNWIVNPNKRASSVDVVELIKLCQDKVSERFGIHLETELVCW